MVGLCNYIRATVVHLSAQNKILMLVPLGLLRACRPWSLPPKWISHFRTPPHLYCSSSVLSCIPCSGISLLSRGGGVMHVCGDCSAKTLMRSFSYSLLRISHVRDFITKYQGSEGGVPFTLTTSLPFRELQDETLTLEEAKLENAVVVQRLRKTTEPFRLLVIKAPDNDYKSAATPNGQLKNEQKNAINSTRSN